MPRPGVTTPHRFFVSLPLAATVPLATQDIGFGEDSLAVDPLPNQCRGSVDRPTAQPGNVCLYIGRSFGIRNAFQFEGTSLVADASSAVNATGFAIEVRGSLGDIQVPGNMVWAAGSWAYTAPEATP